MTKRELVMAALAGREANRVPLAVWMHSFASENSARGLAAETPTNSGPASAVDLPAGRGAQLGQGQSPSRERLHSRWDPKVGSSLHAIETRHDSEPFLLPRCRTTPIHPIRPQSQV